MRRLLVLALVVASIGVGGSTVHADDPCGPTKCDDSGAVDATQSPPPPFCGDAKCDDTGNLAGETTPPVLPDCGPVKCDGSGVPAAMAQRLVIPVVALVAAPVAQVRHQPRRQVVRHRKVEPIVAVAWPFGRY